MSTRIYVENQTAGPPLERVHHTRQFWERPICTRRFWGANISAIISSSEFTLAESARHTGQEAYAVKKNWAWKETKSIFKLMYQVTKIHWETNILIVSFLEIDRLVFFPM